MDPSCCVVLAAWSDDRGIKLDHGLSELRPGAHSLAADAVAVGERREAGSALVAFGRRERERSAVASAAKIACSGKPECGPR